MTIQFAENKMSNYKNKKEELSRLIQNGASQEDQAKAFGEMYDALVEDLHSEVKHSVANENYDSTILSMRGANQLTNEEIKFYNELTTDVGFKDEKLIPETIINRVFEDLEKEHPFLKTIKINVTGVRSRVIEANPEGQVVWGKLFDDIRGQLDATFSEKDLTLGKATCFVVVPKDLKDTGVTWIDAFVRAQIREAYSVAFEKMAILGEGRHKNQPVGLMKDIDPDTGAVTDKAVAGTFTFANPETSIKELAGALAKLSVVEKDGKTKYRNVKGGVVVALNPLNALFAEVAFTKVTENNVYVTATPFGVKFVENEFVPVDKAVVFLGNNYEMAIGGNEIVRYYDQTLAIEDCDLYTAKQFAYGEPQDNKSSLVYDLAIDGMPSIDEIPEA